MTRDGKNSLELTRPISSSARISIEQKGLGELIERDKDLSGIVNLFGEPPLWRRDPGFATLLWIILEQQVSLASARTAFRRLESTITPVSPYAFMQLEDSALREMGFSRQKTSYCRVLAQALLQKELVLEALPLLDDESAQAELMRIKGIGPWTADIYLLMALGRPDIWPANDLALRTAVQEIKHLSTKPSLEQMLVIGANWKPWRSVAARLLWHFYLNTHSNNA